MDDVHMKQRWVSMNISDKCIILITLHKPCKLPEVSPVYKPIQVGFEPTINSSFLRDNTGNNIAEKNGSYCELTALYWGWKNLGVDTIGLCHYRRFLGSSHASLISRIRKRQHILTEDQIERMLNDYDIILPNKRHYWIETRGSQYAHAHHIQDLEVTEAVLRERHPDYLPEWRNMLCSRSGHICNMFIMRKELLDEYCSWLFDILFEVEKRLDISAYSDNDKRVMGFLSERMLDVWVKTRKLRYIEVPMINLESQHWLHKGFAFIKRKITGKNE